MSLGLVFLALVSWVYPPGLTERVSRVFGWGTEQREQGCAHRLVSGHVLRRAIERCFKLDHLIGNLHSVVFTFGRLDRYTTYSNALVALLKSDLERGGFVRGAQPIDVRASQHREQVIDITVLRRRHTRGRTDKESPFDEPELVNLVHRAVAFFNGDWRQRQIQHWCTGDCCHGGSLDACVGRATSLLMPLLVDRLSERVPSEHRWHTFGPALETQTFGVLFHGLLCRLTELVKGVANPIAPANEGEAGDADDFKVYRAKKAAGSTVLGCRSHYSPTHYPLPGP